MNAKRRKTPPTPTCESLEGRQLLAAGAGAGPGMPPTGMGGPADFSMANDGFAHSSGHWAGGSARSTSTAAPDASQSAVPWAPMMGGQGGQGALTGRGHLRGMGGAGGFGGQGDLASQGMMFPGSIGSTDANATAASTPLQTDLTKLRTDRQAIHDKSNVTPAMEAKVRNDIKAIKGAETTTPDATATATLQTDIKAAQANPGGPTDAQITQIQADQNAIYKSQGVSDGLIGQWTTDMQAIKTASGVTDADRSTLATDLKAVQADRAALDASKAGATPPGQDQAVAPPDATTTTTPAAAAAPPASATTAAASATPTTPPAVPAMPATPVAPNAFSGMPATARGLAHHHGMAFRSAHRRRG